MRAVKPLRLAITTWLVVLVCAGTLAAQEFRATVNGRVSDPAGLAMPGVTVTATNTQTNEVATAVSNNEGVYSLPFLRPGIYKVAAELQGCEPGRQRRSAGVEDHGHAAGMGLCDRFSIKLEGNSVRQAATHYNTGCIFQSISIAGFELR